MEEYFRYAELTQEEDPLYLFDDEFGERAPELLQDYKVPEYFEEDFFYVLGNARPAHRWLVIGPARSGAQFHQDPNGTLAWNGLISGRKKWILFPPSVTPPGVFLDENGSAVVGPRSVVEWYVEYYDLLTKGSLASEEEDEEEEEEGNATEEEIDEDTDEPTEPASSKAYVECVLGPGEMIFVPSGWWHMVLNLFDPFVDALKRASGDRRGRRESAIRLRLREKRENFRGRRLLSLFYLQRCQTAAKPRPRMQRRCRRRRRGVERRGGRRGVLQSVRHAVP